MMEKELSESNVLRSLTVISGLEQYHTDVFLRFPYC